MIDLSPLFLDRPSVQMFLRLKALEKCLLIKLINYVHSFRLVLVLYWAHRLTNCKHTYNISSGSNVQEWRLVKCIFHQNISAASHIYQVLTLPKPGRKEQPQQMIDWVLWVNIVRTVYLCKLTMARSPWLLNLTVLCVYM